MVLAFLAKKICILKDLIIIFVLGWGRYLAFIYFIYLFFFFFLVIKI